MNYILFDSEVRYQLLPFTHTRPVADIRCGIMTMRERWEYFTKTTTSTLTENYLQAAYPHNQSEDCIYINSSVFATQQLYQHITQLQPQQQLVQNETVIAARLTNNAAIFDKTIQVPTGVETVQYDGAISQLKNNWDIFAHNEQAITQDFTLLTNGRQSAPVPNNVHANGKDNIFIEEGAKIGIGSIINGSTGPVYIGKNAQLLEGAIIRGPIAICEDAVIKMGAKIYGGTTIGNGCKVGGEVSNVVFFANSNKGHDGYLGNAVIGEWCNLGADTNCSNLKNNYDTIKIWDEHNNKSIQTALTFCGLMMGDHSKCAINTMFNTGTTVGVSANIYGSGFPEKFVPSFTWGGSEGLTTYRIERAIDTANRMMDRRHKKLSQAEEQIFKHIFELTQKQRDMFASK